jgi:LAO/AO transport system kinase
MLVATAPKDGAGGSERPHPKRPEVLITTASTGDGVPELLAALDRHRAAGQGPGAGSAARLARAQTLVWAILADRFLATLRDPTRRAATEAILGEVADHHLDPYAAADRLSVLLTGDRGR